MSIGQYAKQLFSDIQQIEVDIQRSGEFEVVNTNRNATIFGLLIWTGNILETFEEKQSSRGYRYVTRKDTNSIKKSLRRIHDSYVLANANPL